MWQEDINKLAESECGDAALASPSLNHHDSPLQLALQRLLPRFLPFVSVGSGPLPVSHSRRAMDKEQAQVTAQQLSGSPHPT